MKCIVSGLTIAQSSQSLENCICAIFIASLVISMVSGSVPGGCGVIDGSLIVMPSGVIFILLPRMILPSVSTSNMVSALSSIPFFTRIPALNTVKPFSSKRSLALLSNDSKPSISTLNSWNRAPSRINSLLCADMGGRSSEPVASKSLVALPFQ